MSLHPSLARVRRPVRRCLGDLDPGAIVMVACSGGADSLALLAATVAEGHKVGLKVYGVTVDHGLQPGSAEHAARVVSQMAQLGADETVSARVEVNDPGIGPEAAARQARYAVLGQLAERCGAVAVLLGHTRDDQAETVLLGLTRGSGGRSLAGMRRGYVAGSVRILRPLLDVPRADTETACQVEGIGYWTDPHNSDPAYTRARVRHRVMPVLEDQLGPGVAATLARTADSLREDTEYLDAVAQAAYQRLTGGTDGAPLPVEELAPMHRSVRRRVLRLAVLAAGAPPAELLRDHVLAVESLVTDWHGQRWIDLPGHLRAVRREGHVALERAPTPPVG